MRLVRRRRLDIAGANFRVENQRNSKTFEWKRYRGRRTRRTYVTRTSIDMGFKFKNRVISLLLLALAAAAAVSCEQDCECT